jgi:hypothetical protein
MSETRRYQACQLGGGVHGSKTTRAGWGVLDGQTDDFVLTGPQDNLTTWKGTKIEAEQHAAALNAEAQAITDTTSPAYQLAGVRARQNVASGMFFPFDRPDDR